MLSQGYILNNRYRIENIIGRGGLSVVYKATDLEANGAVRAVKEISKSCKEMAESAKQESILIKELYEHDKYNFFPNIIQRTENNSTLYIVMDYIDGASMNSLLKSGAFSQNMIIEYGKEICSVMQFIHDYGKIYSDMKPDNIMIINNTGSAKRLGTEKRSGTLKLIDFGAVVQMESGIPVQYTPEYAAPEQFRAERLDRRTDIFNIGATLYHMATGRKPLPVYDENKKLRPSSERFPFNSKDIKTDVSVKKIIRKCVEDNPAKRFRSCRDLYSAIEKTEKHSQIKITLFSASATILSALICAFSYIRYIQQENIEYERFITTAKKSVSYEEKTELYKNAINLQTKRTEAYFGLIETYKEDLSFDENESYDILRLLTVNSEELKKNPDYELLAFETGKLYWYYYDYGAEHSSDNSATRMKASAEWFSDAISENLRNISEEKYQMARIYHDIGNFHSEIQKLVIEGDDTDTYTEYWQSLNEMSDFAETSSAETEIVLLETYRMIINSLAIYTYKFASFIPEEDIRNLYYKTRKSTESVITTTEKTKDLKQKIRKAYQITEDAIERAYGGRK
ncbi:MAG: serine/threonine-protein kinase [Oscillospiraceae bacterium]|nr:serine/threonine-protein kinase [Oscillospiraceae bacterium]